MLTRAGVAKRLGRSIATVRRLEGTELHPWTDARGVHQFDSAEVERLAHSDDVRERHCGQTQFNDLVEITSRRPDERLEAELAAAQEALRAAGQRAATLESQNQELRAMAIEALELLQVVMDSETPDEVRLCLYELRGHH